jgi:hypothetical protein
MIKLRQIRTSTRSMLPLQGRQLGTVSMVLGSVPSGYQLSGKTCSSSGESTTSEQ